MTPLDRRRLLASLAAGAAVAAGGKTQAQSEPASPASNTAKANVEWPVWDEAEQQGLVDVLQSGKWGRTAGGKRIAEFEAEFAKLMDARYCLAVSSGTTAIITALAAAGCGPGDEVIIPPYTFVATFNAVTMHYCLPVFADIDPKTFQMDATKAAARVTEATRVVMPVHIGGSAVDLDAFGELCSGRTFRLIEDACQAPLAQWRGKPLGTHGVAGCFSFQASKNITSGDGGAILTNDEAFMHACHNFHTPGNAKPVSTFGRGANFRLTEFQAAVLTAQLSRAEQQSQQRESNAEYLTSMLREIPGITPARQTEGCTRSAWHLYMLRYDTSRFGGKTRAEFLKELTARRVSASGGYTSLLRSKHVQSLAENSHYHRIYGQQTMQRWLEENQCPKNDRLCEEAVWFTQSVLLRPRSEMERIASVIADVQKQFAN
ncbi:MAG: DegT/DnrJ/EryC1/StrS family aminotransferase [Pirellulales bacterium]